MQQVVIMFTCFFCTILHMLTRAYTQADPPIRHTQPDPPIHRHTQPDPPIRHTQPGPPICHTPPYPPSTLQFGQYLIGDIHKSSKPFQWFYPVSWHVCS